MTIVRSAVHLLKPGDRVASLYIPIERRPVFEGWGRVRELLNEDHGYVIDLDSGGTVGRLAGPALQRDPQAVIDELIAQFRLHFAREVLAGFPRLGQSQPSRFRR